MSTHVHQATSSIQLGNNTMSVTLTEIFLALVCVFSVVPCITNPLGALLVSMYKGGREGLLLVTGCCIVLYLYIVQSVLFTHA